MEELRAPHGPSLAVWSSALRVGIPNVGQLTVHDAVAFHGHGKPEVRVRMQRCAP
jgi:hypothetical protein